MSFKSSKTRNRRWWTGRPQRENGCATSGLTLAFDRTRARRVFRSESFGRLFSEYPEPQPCCLRVLCAPTVPRPNFDGNNSRPQRCEVAPLLLHMLLLSSFAADCNLDPSLPGSHPTLLWSRPEALLMVSCCIESTFHVEQAFPNTMISSVRN